MNSFLPKSETIHLLSKKEKKETWFNYKSKSNILSFGPSHLASSVKAIFLFHAFMQYELLQATYCSDNPFFLNLLVDWKALWGGKELNSHILCVAFKARGIKGYLY